MGTQSVKEDVGLLGRIPAVARDGWPLLVVTGRILSKAHGEAWRWKGSIFSLRDAFLAGPVHYVGPFMGKTGRVPGAGCRLSEARPPLSTEHVMKVIARVE